MGYTEFRNHITPRDICVAGIAVHVEYRIAQAFDRVARQIVEGVTIVSPAGLRSSSSRQVVEENGRLAIKRSIRNTTPEESAAVLGDFMAIMALFTDDDTLKQIVEEAPKSADHHLVPNYVVREIHMDGAFRDAEGYVLFVLTEEGDRVVVTVQHARFVNVPTSSPVYLPKSFLTDERYGAIARRLGLLPLSGAGEDVGEQHLVPAAWLVEDGIVFDGSSAFAKSERSAHVKTPPTVDPNGGWDPDDFGEFCKMLCRPRTVAFLKKFVKSAGYEQVPVFAGYAEGDAPIRVNDMVQACLCDPDHALDKIAFLVESGMWGGPSNFQNMLLDFDAACWTAGLGAGRLPVGNIRGEGWCTKVDSKHESRMAALLRDVLGYFLSLGCRVRCHEGFGPAFVTMFHDDEGFLASLKEFGVDYERIDVLSAPAVFKYFLAHGMENEMRRFFKSGRDYFGGSCLNRHDPGARVWGEELLYVEDFIWDERFSCAMNRDAMDYYASVGVTFPIDAFDPDCSFELYRRAVDAFSSIDVILRADWRQAGDLQGKVARSKIFAAWAKVFAKSRVDIGEFLLSRGLPIIGSYVVRGNGSTFIDWALERGFLLSGVDVNCDRETLLHAAWCGVGPVGDLDTPQSARDALVPMGSSLCGGSASSAHGMGAICELQDIELIKAFLDAGFTDGVSVRSAIDSDNKPLLDLYQSYGFSLVEETITKGECYVKDGVATIPEGVKRIECEAFRGIGVRAIALPESLEFVGTGAFSRFESGRTDNSFGEVVVPKGVKSIASGSFVGYDRIVVYDSIEPDARPAEDGVLRAAAATSRSYVRLGELQVDVSMISKPDCGVSLGLAGTTIFPFYDFYDTDYEIVVRSEATNEVKYRVEMNLSHARRGASACLVSAWGKNATIDFPTIDALFREFSEKRGKIKTAINRLLWPIDLSEEYRSMYVKYLSRYAKDAIDVFCFTGDLDAVKLMASLGLVKKSNICDMVKLARRRYAGNKKIRKYLTDYQKEHFPQTLESKR